MATANTSDALSDVLKWTKGLEAGKRILQINSDVTKQIEVVRSVAKQAEEVKADRDSVRKFKNTMKSLTEACDEVLTLGKTLSMLEEELNKRIRGLRQPGAESHDEDVVEDCVRKLETIFDLAQNYSEKLNNYEAAYNIAVRVCQELLEEFHNEVNQAQESARGCRNTGIVVTGIGSLAAALAGFFVAGPVGSAIGFVGAIISVGGMTAVKVSNLQKSVKEFRAITNILGVSTKELGAIKDSLEDTKQAQECLTDSMALVIQSHRSKIEKQKLVQEMNELKIRNDQQEEELRVAREKIRTLSERNRLMTAGSDAAATAKALDDKDDQIRELQKQLQEEKQKQQNILQLLGSK